MTIIRSESPPSPSREETHSSTISTAGPSVPIEELATSLAKTSISDPTKYPPISLEDLATSLTKAESQSRAEGREDGSVVVDAEFVSKLRDLLQRSSSTLKTDRSDPIKREDIAPIATSSSAESAAPLSDKEKNKIDDEFAKKVRDHLEASDGPSWSHSGKNVAICFADEFHKTQQELGEYDEIINQGIDLVRTERLTEPYHPDQDRSSRFPEESAKLATQVRAMGFDALTKFIVEGLRDPAWRSHYLGKQPDNDWRTTYVLHGKRPA